MGRKLVKKSILRIARRLGAERVGRVPDAGGGVYGMARLARIVSVYKQDLSKEVIVPPTAQEVTNAALKAAAHVLDHCQSVIEHCLGQLSEEQVWWRPREEMNSVGNLVLHLTGNLRQWIVAGLGGLADVRRRPEEFSQRGPIAKALLLERLREVVSQSKSVLAGVSAEAMLARRTVQGFELDGWQTLFDTVPHFKGHTQEIVCLTRLQRGADYRFHWQPTTPEQGAPA